MNIEKLLKEMEEKVGDSSIKDDLIKATKRGD